jgi:hypothetical protein
MNTGRAGNGTPEVIVPILGRTERKEGGELMALRIGCF